MMGFQIRVVQVTFPSSFLRYVESCKFRLLECDVDCGTFIVLTFRKLD